MALTTELPASGFTAMPWRNGVGTTHEIAVDDSTGASAAPFRWRLSMADLAGDGPFSEIADVDRILVLLSGDGVALTIASAPLVALGEHEAIAFPGDVPTSLTMTSTNGRDLNLMWDRTRAHGAVELLEIGDQRAIATPVAFAIAIGGHATIAVDDEEFALGEQDALRLDDGGTLIVIDGEVYLATID